MPIPGSFSADQETRALLGRRAPMGPGAPTPPGPGWVSLSAGRWTKVWGGLIWRVFALDAQRAWTAEEGGRIRHTTNGGASWIAQSVPPTIKSYIRGIYFMRTGASSGVHGWAVGFDGIVLKTVNAGTTWTQLCPPLIYASSDPDAPGQHVDLWGVYFVDDLHGWVVGIRTLRKTVDGGATWIPLESEFTNEDSEPYAVAPTHDTLGLPLLSSAEPGTVFRSTNGDAWPNQIIAKFDALLANNLELWDVQMRESASPGTGVGYLCGGQGNQTGGMLSTADGGQTWTREVANNVPPTQYGITPLAGDAAISVGYAGSVYLRGALVGGIRWTDIRAIVGPVNDDVTIPLLGCGSDRNLAVWVVGVMGHIHHSADAGATWTNQGSHGQYRLRDVAFLTRFMGWAVAQVKTLLFTTDGGRTWIEQIPPTPGGRNLNSIRAFDIGHVVAVGNGSAGHNPELLWYDATQLPGNPWFDATLLTPKLNVTLNEVCWVNGDCWAVGTNGTILRSTDGFGAVWDVFPGPVGTGPVNFTSLAFDGISTLYVVGSAGGFTFAFRLSYPALVWEDISISITTTWNVVVARGDDVYAVGSGPSGTGEVYKFATDTLVWSLVYPRAGDPAPEQLLTAALTGDGPYRVLFVAGQRGQSLRLEAGIWFNMRTETNVVMTGMCFITPVLGFMCGNQSIDAAGEGVGDSALIAYTETPPGGLSTTPVTTPPPGLGTSPVPGFGTLP